MKNDPLPHIEINDQNVINMEKIKVNVAWCEKNFGATLGDNVPGAVALTAKTYEELQREVPETLRFHIDGMLADGDSVPQWLADGDYEFEYCLTDVATMLRASTHNNCHTMQTVQRSLVRNNANASWKVFTKLAVNC